jgi:hypothetical protein
MSHNNARKATRRVMDMMDQGVLDPRTIADLCLRFMSEDEVAQFAHANQLFEDDDDEAEEDADEE